MTDLATLDADLKRFWAQVERTDSCWLWRGAQTGQGYGGFMTRRADHSRQYWPAHRYAYTHTVGLIPEGMFLLHSCDHPACVRPDHLRVGTQKENIADAIERGRWKRPPLQREVRGHLFKVSLADAALIREARRSGVRVMDIAAAFAVSPSYVSNIIAGRAGV